MKLFIKSILPLSLIILVVSVLTGCGSSDEKTSDSLTPAARQHAALRASLRDSATYYNQRSLELQRDLDSVKTEFDNLVVNMEATDRGDYVETYRVAKGWRNYDTMSGTGILARLLEDGEVEVVASSSAGSFSSVVFSSGSDSVSTNSVKAGNGLNYTVGNITRVTFIGADALALCDFAEAHKGDIIKLSFVGVKTSVVTLSASQVDMLAFIGRIVAVKKQLDKIQRDYMIAFNKAMLYEGEVRKDSISASSK